MLVYRKKEEVSTPMECLRRIDRMLSSLEESPAHERALGLFIEWGEFESAVTDALCPETDSHTDTLGRLRACGLLTGHMLYSSWNGLVQEIPSLVSRLRPEVKKVLDMGLPELIRLREPEGYAHYGLFPEVYIKAAEKFFKEASPEEVNCIGLRSIGSSLSSAVAATLERNGCRVRSFTFRPRGHPFNRRIVMDGELKKALLAQEDACFLLVDEGPGKSGSSFSGAAQGLSCLGIPDERICFFPSWNSDGEGFVTEWAKTRWRRHRKYCASFEEAWVETGRLSDGLPAGELRDISAGGWRGLFYGAQTDWPPAHPLHEKRKYLLRYGSEGGEKTLLVRFAGHGRYGRAKYERALSLAATGLIQPVAGLKDGFLLTGFVDGRPISAHEVDKQLLECMASYMAFVSRNMKGNHDASFDEMLEMIRRNVFLGLGKGWIKKLKGLEAFREVYDESAPVEVDGRMLPHEWLRTPSGYMKADAFDHHADQFFPGRQDIAWDMAGALIEFGLGGEEGEYLMSAYERLTGDRFIRDRLPFYLIAYLAYRLGYVTFAADELASTGDGERFAALRDRYRACLMEETVKFHSAGEKGGWPAK